jgi:ketol-acid reductoisomerase
MKKILEEIQNGSFAKRWIAENQQGRPEFDKRRRDEREQMIERVGADLRRMMPFVDPVTIKPGD